MFRDYGDSDNNISDKEPSISINYESSKNFTKKEISKSTKTSRCINISFNNNIINNSNLHLYLKFYNEIRDIIFGQNVKDDNISFTHEEMIKRINKLKELESAHKIKFEIISEIQLSFFVVKKDEKKIENEKKFDDKKLHICGRVETYNYCDKYNKKRKNNGINEITRVANFEFKKRCPSINNKKQIKNEMKNLEKKQETSKTLNRRNNKSYITYNNNVNYNRNANYIYPSNYINNNNNVNINNNNNNVHINNNNNNNVHINTIPCYKSKENIFDKNKKIKK
jgi:hypothetical protein